MTKRIRNFRLQLILGAGLAALSLQACDKPAATSTTAVTSPPAGALPLDSAGLPPPPASAALPPAPPAPVAYVQAPRQRYRYVDRAAAMNGAFADSPPDYTVDYDGSRPWIWRARDGSRRVVEHTPDGDRYYYYDAGADEPYLVRGPDYTYGYDQGRLAVVYDSQGRALDDAEAAARAERAGEYLARARQLYYAAEHQQHEAVIASDWQAHRDAQFAEERQWEADQQNQADWRAWHEQNAYQPPVYVQERDNRAAYAASLGAVAVGAFAAGRLTAPPPGPQGQPYANRPYQGGPGPAPVNGFQDPRVAQAAQQAQLAQARQAQALGQARQQQAQADSARQAQQAAQANAIGQARQQQAQADAARQAQLAAQQRGVAQARQQQMQADAAKQAQARAQAQAQASQAAQAHNAALAQARGQEVARQAQAAQVRSAAVAQQAQANQARTQALAQAAQARNAAMAQQAQLRVQQGAAREAQAAQARNAAMAQQAQLRGQAQAQAAARAQAEAAKAHAVAAAKPAPAAKPEPKGKDDHHDHNVGQP